MVLWEARFSVVFSDLGRIPTCIPAETCTISICERLAKLESRVTSNEETLSKHGCDLFDLGDKISSKMPSYATVVSDPEPIQKAQPVIVQPSHVNLPPECSMRDYTRPVQTTAAPDKLQQLPLPKLKPAMSILSLTSPPVTFDLL